MTLAIIFGVSLFAALALSFVLLMGGSSASASFAGGGTRRVRAGGPAFSVALSCDRRHHGEAVHLSTTLLLL